MKAALFVGLALAACVQVHARAIAKLDLPKVLQDTMEQSFSCALQMGPKAQQIPRTRGIDLLPEDNAPLQELWGCIWKKKEIINEDDSLSEDKLYSYLVDLFSIFGRDQNDMDIARNITDNCKGIITAEYYGLKAVKIENCIKRELKKL